MKVAKALLTKLEELKINVFLKTSGATGIHLYVPMKPVYTYEQLRTFAEIVVRMVTAENPGLVTNERTVAKRPAGRVLIDVQQNAEGRPLAGPYVVRAFPKAPVSAPIAGKELKAGLKPDQLNLRTMAERMEDLGDFWEKFWEKRQGLEDAIERLSKVVS